MTLQEIWQSIKEFFTNFWGYFFGKKEKQQSPPVHQIPEVLKDVPINIDDTTQDVNNVIVGALPTARETSEKSLGNGALKVAENVSAEAQYAGMGTQFGAGVASKVAGKESVKQVTKAVSSGIEKFVMKPLFIFDAIYEGIEIRNISVDESLLPIWKVGNCGLVILLQI